MLHDEVGVEAVIRVHDPKTGMRGVLVIDNSVNGPAGGGTRMVPDLTEDEVGELARAMTYKWAIFDLPTGGSKAGIFGDPQMPAAQKREWLLAFGRALKPYLSNTDFLLGVGPDMGLHGRDVDTIYEGAGESGVKSWENSTEWFIEGESAAYHLTGRGVAAAAKAALDHLGRPASSATFALEGLGQVGAGTARYMHGYGSRLVAVSTLQGAISDRDGIDIPRLLQLRREFGDACVLKYQGGPRFERMSLGELFTVECDVLVPGARPKAINGFNEAVVRARIICPAGNVSVTLEAERRFHRRGVICLPDFVCSGGGIIASWVDYLGGGADDALSAVARMVGQTTTSLLIDSGSTGESTGATARTRVRDQLLSRTSRVSYAEAVAKAKDLFKLTPAKAVGQAT